MVSSGASRIGRGVSGGGGKALRAGERMAPLSLDRGARPGFFGIGGGGSFVIAVGFESRGFSGGGPGEAFRLEGWVDCAGWDDGADGWSLPMFSKCDKREDTGFCGRCQPLAHRRESALGGLSSQETKERMVDSRWRSHQALPLPEGQPWLSGIDANGGSKGKCCRRQCR